MGLHVYSWAAKAYALSLQPQALLKRRVALQFDPPPRAQHALPRQSKTAPQNCHNLPRCSWKPGRPGDAAIGQHLPSRNRANDLLDSQAHGGNVVLMGLAGTRTVASPFHRQNHRDMPGCSDNGCLLSDPAESVQRVFLRVLHVENGQQLGDLQKIAHALGQAGQFNGRSSVVRRGVQRYQSS